MVFHFTEMSRTIKRGLVKYIVEPSVVPESLSHGFASETTFCYFIITNMRVRIKKGNESINREPVSMPGSVRRCWEQ